MTHVKRKAKVADGTLRDVMISMKCDEMTAVIDGLIEAISSTEPPRTDRIRRMRDYLNTARAALTLAHGECRLPKKKASGA